MPKFKVHRRHTFIVDETVVVNAPRKEGAFLVAANLRLYPIPDPDEARMLYDESLMLGIEEYTEGDDKEDG